MKLGLALLLAAAPSAAAAGLPSATLDAVGAHPASGASIPVGARFLDQNGHPVSLGAVTAGAPTLLLFADYKCGYLCGPALVMTAGALKDSGLSPSRYHLVAIGIDPRETPADARAMAQARLAAMPRIAHVARLLTGPPSSIQAAARALGYTFQYDPAHSQFAHDASVYILDPVGRVSDVVSPFELRPKRLRQAIVLAGQGHVAALLDEVHVLCYGLDPSAGVYNHAVVEWLRIAGALTAALIAFLVFGAVRRSRSNAR